jgi:hypothetical protein
MAFAGGKPTEKQTHRSIGDFTFLPREFLR